MIYRKKLLFVLTILLGMASFGYSQGTVTSPYSFIGLGDGYDKGNIRALSMGGVDIALRNPMYINMLNPAGLSGIDSLSFVGSVGVAMNNSTYSTNTLESSFSSANINHLAFAFPITKWWRTGLLLLPYSSVGYEVNDSDLIENVGNVDYMYDGDGGMDVITWSNAFSLNKQLAVGISSSYYFGKVEHSRTVNFPDSAYVFNSLVKESVHINGLFFELGLQYHLPLDANNTLGFGLTYGNESKLNASTDYVAVTYLGDDTYNNGTVDTIRVWEKSANTVKLPYSVGFGMSWVKKDKLTVAADFRFENWKDFEYLDSKLDLSNKLRANIGAEFIPESNNLSAYWKMIHYRMGFRYEHLGMKFADNEMKEYALSVGFGLPLRKSQTFVNLGFELGQNGTLENDLIQERFFRVMLGVSIKENWFRKSKYL